MIRHSKSHRRISDVRNPLHNRSRRRLKYGGGTVFTWSVHAPEGDRLQSIGSHGVTRIEETLNGATEVRTPGGDFVVGLPYEMVGELQRLIGDFGTIANALRVLACGLKALLKDFNRGLETIGISERSFPQEGYAFKTSQYIRRIRGISFGVQDVPPRYAATRAKHRNSER